ncbi:MAG: insulinase family protein, partial [Deltaproteobacteria bacterium]|nr:insulinase family protein [Deltaproteobacteria bacterium]
MKAFRKKNQPSFPVQYRRFLLILLLWVTVVLSVVTNLQAASVTDGALRFRLDNGFTVILKENRTAPVAAIQVWVKTGSANETEEEAGITHFIEHMIFKGTPTRKAGDIARTIESSGGNINAYTSLDRTVYYVEMPGSLFHTGLEVLLDAVRHSLFDEQELLREKEVVLEEYRRSLDSPGRRLGKAVMNLCFRKHPYGRPIIGYAYTIRSFHREAILKYMDKWYGPRNMVLTAVGDFHAKGAMKAIRALIRDFPKRTGKRPSRPEEPKQAGLRTTILKEGVQQAYLSLAWRIPALAHPHIPALDLLETILGHGKSSRLYTRLKMKENLVHSIGAGAYALMDPGIFSIDSTLKPEKTDRVLKALGEEMVRVCTAPVSASELQRARAIREADFLFAMETMSGQA